MGKWRRFSLMLAAGAATVAVCEVSGGYLRRVGLDAADYVAIVGDPAPDPRHGPPIGGVSVRQSARAFGFPRLDVDGRGEAAYWYREYRWRGPLDDEIRSDLYRAEFRLTPVELAALHGMVADIGFSRMKKLYTPFFVEVADGDACSFTAVRGGKTREVFCDNVYPRGLRRLRDMAFKTRPAAHAREIAETGRAIEVGDGNVRKILEYDLADVPATR